MTNLLCLISDYMKIHNELYYTHCKTCFELPLFIEGTLTNLETISCLDFETAALKTVD